MTAQQMALSQEILINATPQAVWNVLASADGIKKWLGARAYEPRQGSKIEFHMKAEDGEYDMFGEVVTFDPPNQLAFTWTEQKVGGEPWPVPTLVTITLTQEQGGTRVRLVHTGFEKLPAGMAEEQFKGYQQGWDKYNGLPTLKEMVEGK